MTAAQYERLGEELREAQAGRPGREVFRVLARLWQAEQAAHARRGTVRERSFQIRRLGCSLGLADEEAAAEIRLAAYRQEVLERALDEPLPQDPGKKRRRRVRFVTAAGELLAR